MLVCRRCDWKVRRGARYCARCGRPLGNDSSRGCLIALIVAAWVAFLVMATLAGR